MILGEVSISDGQLLAGLAAVGPAVGAWVAWYRKRTAEAEDALVKAMERVVKLTEQLGEANARAAVLGERVDDQKRELARLAGNRAEPSDD